jgi:hypothetical protein
MEQLKRSPKAHPGGRANWGNYSRDYVSPPWRNTCKHDGPVVLVCPLSWPYDTVALACFYCGDTMSYVDGLAKLRSELPPEGKNHHHREFAMRHGIAVDVRKAEIQ